MLEFNMDKIFLYDQVYPRSPILTIFGIMVRYYRKKNFWNNFKILFRIQVTPLEILAKKLELNVHFNEFFLTQKNVRLIQPTFFS